MQVHNNTEIDAKNHKVKMLLLYSPMLNLIKEAFSCLKAKAKQLLNESMEIILDRAATMAAQQPLTLLLYGYSSKLCHTGSG